MENKPLKMVGELMIESDEIDPSKCYGEDEALRNSVKSLDRQDEAVELLLEQVSQIQQNLQNLSHDFQTKLKYDESKQKIIDQLHGELQEYRNDLIRSLLRPVLIDVIQLADDQRKLLANYKGKDPEDLDSKKLLGLMEDLPDSLDEILYRQGVDIFQNEELLFDPKCQKALKREDTHEQDKSRTISQRLRPGYRWDGRLLRPELVGVYVFREKNVGDAMTVEVDHHE